MARTISTAMLAAALAATACNPIVGFKDPKLDRPTQTDDAATDAEVAMHDASIDMAPTITCPASCTFGCEADMTTCLPAKLWVFQTKGTFAGNGFAGNGTAGDVRKTADTKCFLAASDRTAYPDRGCTQEHTHAIITVDGSDAISVMANNFHMPTVVGITPVEVHRIDDDATVTGSWTDFVGGSTVLTNEPVSLAVGGTDTNMPTDNDIVWTGANGSNTCAMWTSGGTDLGVQGHTRIKSTNWLQRGSLACSQLQHLMCVCWTAP